MATNMESLPLPILPTKHQKPPTVLLHNFSTFKSLRSQHRIVGILTGTLPPLSGQNVFLGLPFLLMSEEAQTLRQRGVAYLTDETTSYQEPTDQLIQVAEEKRKKDIQDLNRRAREAADEERRRFLLANPKIAQRASMKEKRVVGENDTSSHSTTTVDYDVPSRAIIPTLSNVDDMPWYKPTPFTSPDQMSSFETARQNIFQDLYSRGYWLASGLKFGGDFVAYPGDPLRYHSHFVCSVIPSLEQDLDEDGESITAMDIVAWGRLATGVKKNHLICGWDENKQEAEYFTVNWAGYG